MGVRTAIGIALAALLLAALSAVTYSNVRRLIVAGRSMEHTRQVISEIQALLSTLTDGAASARGFALTGEPAFLVPYETASGSTGAFLDRLQALTQDNPAQTARIAEVRRLTEANLATVRRVIQAREQGGLEAAAEVVRGAGVQASLEAVRVAAHRMETAERELLGRRTGNFERTALTTLASLAFGALLLFSFLAIIWALMGLDLQRRQESENRIRLSEEELRITLRSIGDGVIATDAAGRIRLMNPLAERLTGWGESEAAGRDASEVFRVVSETTGEELESPVLAVLREGRPVVMAAQSLLVGRSGDRIAIADSGAPIRDAAGEIRGAVLVFRDITRKRAAEREAQRLAAIVSSSEDAILGESLDGRITAWNAAAERLFGYTAAEVAGKSVNLLEPSGFDEATAARLLRIRRGEPVQKFDTTRVGKDGKVISVSVSISPIRDDQGVVVGASKIVRDITERKVAEAALRASEERFRVLSEAVPSLVWVCDEKGAIQYVNQSWLAYTGTALPDVLAGSWWDAVHPEDRELCLAKWHVAVAARDPFEIELRFRRRDGTHRWFVARASRVASAGGVFVGTAADIDDLKNTAAALRSAKEAAEEAAVAKDRFLAVLSHELRTPLTPALVASQVLERRRDLPSEVRESISLIRRNVELEMLLVDDLLDLTKISRGMIELRRQTVDLHDLARQVLEICQSDLMGRRQQLDLRLEASQHHADADPARIQQVLWNLVKNAIKFTPVGGKVAVHSENPQPGRIRISVEDNGIGIPAGLLPRIFEPFERGAKTVSPRLSGLGLGLSISKRLVELHGGTIDAASDGEGKGAAFAFELPAFVGAAAASPPRRLRERPARKLSILLVEDHHDTAGALAQLLTQEGHAVTVADSVAAAVEAFRHTPKDLLITDLGLPDGSGHELLALLREIRPVEGIVLSGYGMDADIAKSREMGFAQHLTKPVPISRLLRALDELGQDAEAVGREI